MKLCRFIQLPLTSSLLGPNVLNTLFSNTLNLCSPLNITNITNTNTKRQVKYCNRKHQLFTVITQPTYVARNFLEKLISTLLLQKFFRKQGGGLENVTCLIAKKNAYKIESENVRRQLGFR
jgi:hypothetical protein